MRELLFSLGISILTATILFIYFRNKFNNIDNKVNMVFETIQEHNNRLQQQQEQEQEMNKYVQYQERSVEEEFPNLRQAEKLIEVSENESDSDSDESETDDEDTIDDTIEEVKDQMFTEIKDSIDTTDVMVSLETNQNYGDLTKSALRELCEKRQLHCPKSLNKGKLINLLEDSEKTVKLSP
tara:strand:- start:94 stop:639 length:546 start_codon:yes stop_codon:yes gene_type:complete